MRVVKVGGSLFDLPELAERLRRFLAELGDPDHLLVAGGGPMADILRTYDRTHRIGEERSHWLALRACQLNAYVLLELLPGMPLVIDPLGHHGPGILDPLAFVCADEGRLGSLPHCWEATSDSVAARAAIVGGGDLVLLKSVMIPETMTWEEAVRERFVDPVLPGLVRAHALAVQVIDFRRWGC